MNAQQILHGIQALTQLEQMNIKVKESEETIRTLLVKLDKLSKNNEQQQQTLDAIFHKMQCPACRAYLESKSPGDTIEGHQCNKVFLTRCWDIQ